MAPIKRKCFIACECVSSHPDNPYHDIRIAPQEWEPDLQVSLRHDDLYARTWECECGRPIFDAENDNATPPNSPEITVQSELSTEENRNTPCSARECSRYIFLQTEELCDVTDTNPSCFPTWNLMRKQARDNPIIV